MAPISTSSGKPIIYPNAQMRKTYSFCITSCLKEREFNSRSTFSCENKTLIEAVHVCTCPVSNKFGMILRITD